ncbi:MAG: FlgD immunoglobulin-like domain containing protein, partial [Acidobacteriota bacterium]
INPLAEIFNYTIWRAIAFVQASKLIAGGATVWEEGTTLKALSSEPSLRLAELQGEPYFWTKVGEVESSHYIDTYATTVPTLFDSTATSAEPHYFQVIAHGYATPEHWCSEAVAGRSVDNLAPAAPSGLAGAQVYDPAGLALSWGPNAEADLAGYEVYRGASVDFVPDAENFVTSTADTLAIDEGWSSDGGYWYKVAAVDVHGNVSSFAVLAPGTVSSVPTASLPAVPLIEQNFPNPFNPQTTIAFEIPSQQDVTLRVFALSGRLVRILSLGETHTPGRHEVVWDGRDDAGRQVASGTYFYRLEAGAFAETKRMVLVK